MLNELCLYFELLIYLAGTFLYRFLTRELLRRPQVLPGNWPLRGLLFAVTSWYTLTLADELLFMLLGTATKLAAFGIAIDLVRGWAWLLFFPLLVQTLVRVLAFQDPGSPRWLRLLSYPGYLALPIFVPAALEFARSGDPRLAQVSRVVFPQVAAYCVVLLVLAAGLVLRMLARVEDRRMAAFLRLFLAVLVAMGTLMVLGSVFDPWSADASGGERVLRTLLMGVLLLPGGLFAFFVQRYNLLRLSLSHRTLRHFSAVLILVVLVMLAGPALGLESVSLFRRFVAWGMLLALFLGLAYQPLLDRALLRSTALRRFLGKNVTPRDLDRLMVSLQRGDLDEGEALERTAKELGRWLGAEVAFLPPGEEERYRDFWEHYADAEAPLVHRLLPPTPRLAFLLGHEDLHAVFPLRVEGRLEGLLGLSVSATGGGYDMAELEAVQLLVRQLAATLALRRLVEARIAEERRLAELAEHERLRMLGLVAASLAHEVKNPLSSMKALAQALREDLATGGGAESEEGVADLDAILEQVDRLDKTTREILGLARPRAGTTTGLTALVRSSLYVLRAEAKKRGVDLQDAGVDELGQVAGSETAWQTVVFNLMLNAVEHTPPGERAEVELHADDGGVLFLTRNPGEPLCEEEAEQLFEPFVSDGGTGLGLALVKRRVEELDGRVEVRCEGGQVVFRVTASAGVRP